MALNPVAYTEKVVGSFLRYQLTAYPFADANLYAQMRALLSLDVTRNTPLFKGPYVSLSRAFRSGATLAALEAEGLAHPLLKNLHPHPALYGHQEKGYRSIAAGNPTLVSTGTGSGKTETFLYPIIDRCLRLRDQHAPPGIVAVIVYPMNALAEDQLGRMRELLSGTGITFGMYVGKTPEKKSEVTKLPVGSSAADYNAAVAKSRQDKLGVTVHPPEERCSREEMRTPGEQPRILLTNVKQLELLLTRQADVEMFDGARLEFLVFDEAHTFGGAAGAETACLIRRLRAYCGRTEAETVCVATSATIADRNDDTTAREFAARFFGVDAARVTVVGEEYEPHVWANHLIVPAPLPGPLPDLLRDVLQAVDADTGDPVVAAYRKMTGRLLPAAQWQEALHQELGQNRIAYELAEILKTPKPLPDLVQAVSGRVGRPVPEEEVLIWLTLGAAARKDSRPLLRPVAHGFVRGVGGAVVTFPVTEDPRIRLHLSAEDAVGESGNEQIARLPVLTCSTCGQHYFEHHVQDFTFLVTDRKPGGGQAHGKGIMWPPQDASLGGDRVILLDRLISDEDEDTDDPARTAQVCLCRCCGALHDREFANCNQCGRDEPPVRLLAAAQKDEPSMKGKLPRCLSCGANARITGGSVREPIRAVRATAVSDVHVLAQDMVRNAERDRLLIFADNRQDAAFQAGWMRDHARRFRLRALMLDQIQQLTAIGDLVVQLDQQLDADDDLSQALMPEVWDVARKQGAPVMHRQERERFLRIKVLLEVAMTIKQRQGLEPFGRIRVDYLGLDPTSEFVAKWADALDLAPAMLVEGISGVLDRMRRNYYLFDRQHHLFTRVWQDGDREVQRGYLSVLRGVPKGQKLTKDASSGNRLQHWLGPNDTTVRQIVRAWHVPEKKIEPFIRELWETLGALKILVPVTLLSSHSKPLPECAGAHQIDADLLRLVPNTGLWRCRKCRRAQPRPAPFDRCLSWRCDGLLAFEPESPDNYDIQMLSVKGRMLRPREHSAQVPAADREQLENLFKGDSESVNTLVATPTLELGVDIGALDSVLMRNVPPLPANYWQRAGRAGRRHRMAVVLSYARSSSHDQAYFAEPLRMLEGRVAPPRFNLRNDLMVEKHVHASVITRLRQLARPIPGGDGTGVSQIQSVLDHVLPRQIKDYLFDAAGNLLPHLFDVSPLHSLIEAHHADLLQSVNAIFAQGWPVADSAVVTPERLEACVTNMTQQLQDVVKTLRKRLNWALDHIKRLELVRHQKGTLDPEDDALFRRCDRLVKRYKGHSSPTRHDAAGHDDINTYNVLAAEGFLPGYGLEIGGVKGTAIMSGPQSGRDFELPRMAAMAVREYVPGNLIYANGHRFVPRYFHLEPQEARLAFHVDPASQSIQEAGAAGGVSSLSVGALTAIPICDVDMAHTSHISDEEDYRFQIPVAVYGHERNRHSGGKAWRWGDRDLLHRRGVHLRVVNVGPAGRIDKTLGYPVCLVCGQSRSPFASQTERKAFADDHLARCGRAVEDVGFYADVVADAISLPGCAGRDEAYSLAEALRMGATQVLEMEREDLEILVIGKPGQETCDVLLYDPMPGGSGLLEQLISRFPEVIERALATTLSCPADCARACIDCLYTFRNSFFHRHLDRKLASELMQQWGGELEFAHEIPPKLPAAPTQSAGVPVNDAETRLRYMLEHAGFPDAEWHHQILLGQPLHSTVPDCFWSSDEDDMPGVCLYLDGLSDHIHGNPHTRERDQAIRAELRSRLYDVIEITAAELTDKGAMTRRFFKLGQYLIGSSEAKKIRDNPEWFTESSPDSDRNTT